MAELVDSRAVKIAARVMVAAGLCRYDNVMKCRRIHVDNQTCEKCVRDWLRAKARMELKGEGNV